MEQEYKLSSNKVGERVWLDKSFILKMGFEDDPAASDGARRPVKYVVKTSEMKLKDWVQRVLIIDSTIGLLEQLRPAHFLKVLAGEDENWHVAYVDFKDTNWVEFGLAKRLDDSDCDPEEVMFSSKTISLSLWWVTFDFSLMTDMGLKVVRVGKEWEVSYRRFLNMKKHRQEVTLSMLSDAGYEEVTGYMHYTRRFSEVAPEEKLER